MVALWNRIEDACSRGDIMMIHNVVIALALLLGSASAQAQLNKAQGPVWSILSDAQLLRATGIPVLSVDPMTGAAHANVNTEQRIALTRQAHKMGRCGGYEVLGKAEIPNNRIFGLRQMELKNQYVRRNLMSFSSRKMVAEPTIMKAVAQVDERNLRDTVTWLSSFPNRYNKGPNPNAHVVEMKARLEGMVRGAPFPIAVDLIDHTSTPQKSIRVHIEGKSRPSEIIVLGGHLDSINSAWFGAKDAPGADDNASGSSNLVEALRILIQQGQPARSVEFFWYAGEESGLLGSKEIAAAYRANRKDVVAVLQLDMTLFPGDGEFVLGSMTDFTSAWLREQLTGLNALYIKAKIVEDRCGYGCSDHASWHSQGFPALMPFESTMRRMNHDIHTARDVISSTSSFRHSATFSKIAVAFAMELGNSTSRSP